jgi:hypothetical protein
MVASPPFTASTFHVFTEGNSSYIAALDDSGKFWIGELRRTDKWAVAWKPLETQPK